MPKRRSLSEALDRTFRHSSATAARLSRTAGDGATWLIKPVETAAISIEDRLRPVLDDAKVEAIAESLAIIGLTSPILIRCADRADSYTLVAGTHRLEAARRLGWEFIDARIVQGPLDQMRLMEIDENLARAELTPLDRARFLAERKRIYERLHPDRRHGGDRTRPAAARNEQQTDILATCAPTDQSDQETLPGIVAVRSFAADAGDLCGFSERTVRRALEVGEGLATDVAVALAQTPLARREGDLRAIARMPHDDQRELIKDMQSLDNPPRTLREVQLPESAQHPDTTAMQAPSTLDTLKQLWLRADDHIRDSFRSWIDEQE